MPTTLPKIERPWIVAAALAALHLALALLAFQPAPYIGGDNGVYVALARSLAENGSYRDLWDPALRPHAQYPPLFPALLALGVLGGVRGWIGFKLLTVACSAAAVAASYLWLRRVSTPGIALAAGVLLAMMPGPLVLAAQVLSDVPFWALVMLALWGAVGAEAEGRNRWATIAAAGVALAYMTRAAGLPLVLAVLAALAFRRRWREAATVAAGVLPPAVLWWLWGRWAGAPEYAATLRYIDPYQPAMGTLDAAGLVERVGRNAMNYLGEHLPVILGGRSAFHVIVAALLAVLALAGWARRMRR
ncbi:MAG TPA: glycosyltransferase family 39 protein, partial [Longimicrobium sp.]